MNGLSDVTSEWISSADMEHREKLGQYMTPDLIRNRMVELLELRPGMEVLDPAVGTGELLRGVLDSCPEVRATGWDIDPSILGFARRLTPEAELLNVNGMEQKPSGRFDLVVANPPYFQMKLDDHLKHRFGAVISGRPNIFACFFKVAMDQLKDGGRLAFIVPPAMNGGAYFTALRDFILASGRIRHLEVIDRNDLFHNANVAVQIIIVEKGESGNDFVFEHRSNGNRRTLFCECPDKLAAEYEGRRTLHETGFRVFTGPVVWNTRRDDLGPGDDSCRLVWSHQIGHGELLDTEKDNKPGWVKNQSPIEGPAIVVNRVVGKVGGGQIRAAMVEGPFTAENHVNVICPGDTEVSPERVVEALTAEGVGDRLRMLTGNTQLSAVELAHHLPLDI